MQYELFYLVGENQEANLGTIKENVNAMLVLHQAKLIDPELSEKRKLSYEIKHQKRGTYITRRFELPEIDERAEIKGEAEPSVEAITKKLNLTNDVLRFLIVKTEDLPELGAKEKRKAQEMGAQAQASQRPQRSAERQKPTYQQPRRQEQPRPVQSQPKEEAKDIDKQLDKLLDI
jgi:ribosomal protein S6